jgi:hypothetical protein
MATQLDGCMARIQDHLPSIAESWIKEDLNRQIDRQPDHIESLGIEKLRILKDKVKALVASLPEIVKTETSAKQDWPHHRTSLPRGYSEHHEPFFYDAFRDIIGHYAAILDEFGLLKTDKGSTAIWERPSPGKFRYAINPGLERYPNEPEKEYTRIYKEYRDLVKAMDVKQQELAKAKARELWESA